MSNLTVFDMLLERLARAAEYNPDDQVRPAVILWPDGERQWERLLPNLRQSLPHFLTLGAYQPEKLCGPAIWLRCMVDRQLPEANWSEEVVPVLYLPGISRQELRAVENCSPLLKPLAELQYRGVYFSQVSHRDWTLTAFMLSQDGGLGLDLSRDNATLEALSNALPKLATVPVAELTGRRLIAEDFNQIVNPDPDKALLRWLDQPDLFKAAQEENEWRTFIAGCREKYGFDPEQDGPLAAAEMLGRRDGAWAAVWERFIEAPVRYPGIPERLRQARPQTFDNLFYERSSWPQENEEAEVQLRQELLSLKKVTSDKARDTIHQLEARHGERREWVWAELGQAPLAQALLYLDRLALYTKKVPGGANRDEMVKQYVEYGWETDAAALDALALTGTNADMIAIHTAVRAVYNDWLEEGALRYQQLTTSSVLGESGCDYKVDVSQCILFADGLRFDLGKRLTAFIKEAGMDVELSWGLAALPTVTATAKPAMSPVAWELGTGGNPGAFTPGIKGQNKELSFDRFRKLLEEAGYQLIETGQNGHPGGHGWTECGKFDHYGHDLGIRMASMVEGEIQGLVQRVKELVEAGWELVRVVTDHGWLLLPGGLPKTDLPGFLAESRWGRCAALKEMASVNLPIVPWHWDPAVRVATASGISCFRAGLEYDHGGLSLQECVLPLITIKGGKKETYLEVQSIKWVGLRCRLNITGGSGLTVDIRTKMNDPATSLVDQPKIINSDGSCSLLVSDDGLEGTAATLVVIDKDGRQVAKYATVVGG